MNDVTLKIQCAERLQLIDASPPPPPDSGIAMPDHRHLRARGACTCSGVSFEAQRGQVYAIVGPSGCGKSTLLYLLGLLDCPDDGEVEINGKVMSNHDDQARTAARGAHIGFVFQFHFLMLEFTELENVMMPMHKLGRLTPDEMKERDHDLLESVGLGAKTNRLSTQLSGGEQLPSGGRADRKSDVNPVWFSTTRLAKDHGQAVTSRTTRNRPAL